MKTESELLFENYCASKGASIQKIGEAADKRPDYFVDLADTRIVVEVKQINPNKEELAKLAKYENEKGTVIACNMIPGERVRGKITDAGKQIANLAKGRYPSLLVLYNTVPFILGSPLEPYNIRVGMYGLDTIIFSRPIDFEEIPVVLERKFGPKKN